jgi:hypothetical protein
MLHTDLIAPIPELLRRQAAARGSKCAFRDAQTAVTYAELCDRTGKLAGHLGDNGIATGDAVAVMLPNSVAWVESCFAITRAGGVGVPIPYDATEAEISRRPELSVADKRPLFVLGGGLIYLVPIRMFIDGKQTMSAYDPNADIRERNRGVRFAPESGHSANIP